MTALPERPSQAAAPARFATLFATLRRAMGLALALALVTALSEPLIWYFKFGASALGTSLHVFLTLTVLHFADAASMLAVLVIGHHILPTDARRRGPALALLVVAVALAGLAMFSAVSSMRFDGEGLKGPALPYQLQQHASFALLFVIGYEYAARSRSTGDALHGTRLQRLALDRELDGAQLQLLQAQVEPHFLFNTLANLRRLVRTDRAAARAMLGDLLQYLEVALPRLREERSTLAREAALVRAYLAVHQVRMGARLRSTVDVPEALGEREVPPMVLVENALKHGVQPLVEGASIRISVQQRPGQLVLSVADTGQGMGSGSGSGSGLANLRARLKAMYGPAASLSLHVNEPRGVIATVVLPDTAA